MKLYKIDFGWQGGYAIVAETPEDAFRLLMNRFPDPSHVRWREEIDEKFQDNEYSEEEIVNGTILDFIGDR
jgi:hypothetical protein